MANSRNNSGNRQQSNGRSSSRSRSGGTAKRQWRKMDLHTHTPASVDYQEPDISGLDILRQAAARGLDILALTDHNSVAGYAGLQREVEHLMWLEDKKRIEPTEQRLLDEYRRVLDKLLVLPGFEFTATFGFHILGIFPPETPVSYLEHLLLTLNIPAELLARGHSAVGSTRDVLTAYEVINEAGGIAIAAHANSAHGVFMRGLDIGGQTRIAYTQDPNLHTLEVTDLDRRGRHTMRRFFDGSKPEYPRPMRCIQGSDSHRLVRKSDNSPYLGVGDRVTEVLLEEVSFEALASVLKGTDLSLTRPYRGTAKAVDFVQLAREEGESLVQSFQPSMAQRGGHQDRVLQDICGMANTNGGTIYVGLSAEPEEAPVGVRDPNKAIQTLTNTIGKRFSPEPVVVMDTLPAQSVKVVRIVVQAGPDIPYAIDNNEFYVRDEEDTSLAVRDEIVGLVEKGSQTRTQASSSTTSTQTTASTPAPEPATAAPTTLEPSSGELEPPRTGVEIVESEKRDGSIYHTLRDLRNGNLINNVTRSSARKLWHYAITQEETGAIDPNKIEWQGNMALVNERRKRGFVLYDLAMKDDGNIRTFYGVSDGGLNDEWLAFVERES